MKRFYSLVILTLILSSGCIQHDVEVRISGTASKALIDYQIGASQGRGHRTLPVTLRHSASEYNTVSVRVDKQSEQGTALPEIAVDGHIVQPTFTYPSKHTVIAEYVVPPDDTETAAIIVAVVSIMLGAVGAVLYLTREDQLRT